jgi:RNA polymerase sigma factor (sigma-70 family)
MVDSAESEAFRPRGESGAALAGGTMPTSPTSPSFTGFRAGNPQVLEALYRAHMDAVVQVVRYGFRVANGRKRVPGLLHCPAAIADLVQDIFVKAFGPTGRAAYDGQREFRPYLLTIAKNTVIDYLRKHGREIPTEIFAIERLAGRGAIGDNSTWAPPEQIDAVGDYLATLPSELRSVHEVRFARCLSQRQAAEKLGISRQNLRTLETRLREGLREVLHRRGLLD